jgi:hypothetical protein
MVGSYVLSDPVVADGRLLADARVVAEDAGRTADDGAGKCAATHRIGHDRAAGRTGKPALGVGIQTTRKGRDKGKSDKNPDKVHDAPPPVWIFLWRQITQ